MWDYSGDIDGAAWFSEECAVSGKIDALIMGLLDTKYVGNVKQVVLTFRVWYDLNWCLETCYIVAHWSVSLSCRFDLFLLFLNIL